MFNSKNGKIFLFISFLFMLTSISNLKENVFNFIFPDIIKNKYINIIEILFFILSIFSIIIADYIQIKHNPVFKLRKKENEKDENIFI